MRESEHSLEPRPLTNTQLAALFACSLPYITKLQAEKGMPPFVDDKSALDWRAINAPPRGRRQIGKNRDETPTTTSAKSSGAGTGGEGDEESLPPNTHARGGRRRGEIINIKKFIKPTADFDGLMLEQAEAVPQIAYGLLLRAAREGDTVEVAAQLKNWADAGKQAGQVRENFLETREKARTLLSLDEVEDVLGTGLQDLRNRMLKQGERVVAVLSAAGAVFTAEQLVLIRAACDGDVDQVMQQITALPERARGELLAS